MRQLLAILFRHRPAPTAPADQVNRLEAAQREALAIQRRKALLAREVQATIARLSR